MTQTLAEFLAGEEERIEQQQKEYEDNKIQRFSVKKGQTKKFILLSAIGEEAELSRKAAVVNIYTLYKEGGFQTNDGQNKRYINLPELDESLHDEEQPFLQIGALKGLGLSKKPVLFLWVLEVENGQYSEPKLYEIKSKIVMKSLMSFSGMQSIVGMQFSVSLNHAGKEYTLNPVNPNDKMSKEEVDGYELKLFADCLYSTTMDSQIKFMNNISQSFSDELGISDDEWMFNDDNTVKEQFLPASSEFEL